jgi:hypothetical protein
MDRGLGRGCRVVVSFVAFAVLVSGLVFAAGVRASGVTCDECTGSYSGTWTASVTYAGGASASLTVNFAESLVPGAGGASAWDLTSASGTVSYTDQFGTCSASFSPNPSLADGLGNSEGPQVDQGAEITVDPWPPSWWSSDPQTTPQALVSSPSTGNPECDDTSLETAYESGGWKFTGPDCHAQITAPLNATTTSPDNCDATYSDNLGNKGTGTLTSTLTISEGTCTCSCAAGGGARDQNGALRVAVAAAASGGGLSVKVGPRRDHFETFALKLSADAAGGCEPYHFTWTRGPIPKPHIPGVGRKPAVAVTVKPKSAGPITAQASSALKIRLTCWISPAVKRSLGISKNNRFLSPCGIPFSYTVQVSDSSSPQKTGQDTLNLRWLPACRSAEGRAELKRKRTEIEHELWKDLGGTFSLSKVIEWVESPELAPAFFVKDVTEIGAAGAKAWAEAGQIDDELTEPNC